MTAPHVETRPAFVVEQKKRSPLPELGAIAALLGATGADFVTTQRGLRRGLGEGNPVMAPFAKAGPIPLAVAQGISNGIVALSTKKLRDEGSKLWWVPSALATAAHGLAAYHNIKQTAGR